MRTAIGTWLLSAAGIYPFNVCHPPLLKITKNVDDEGTLNAYIGDIGHPVVHYFKDKSAFSMLHGVRSFFKCVKNESLSQRACLFNHTPFINLYYESKKFYDPDQINKTFSVKCLTFSVSNFYDDKDLYNPWFYWPIGFEFRGKRADLKDVWGTTLSVMLLSLMHFFANGACPRYCSFWEWNKDGFKTGWFLHEMKNANRDWLVKYCSIINTLISLEPRIYARDLTEYDIIKALTPNTMTCDWHNFCLFPGEGAAIVHPNQLAPASLQHLVDSGEAYKLEEVGHGQL